MSHTCDNIKAFTYLFMIHVRYKIWFSFAINMCRGVNEPLVQGVIMSTYRISSIWSNNLSDRKRFYLDRLKERIRMQAEMEEKKLSRNNSNVKGE